MAAAARPDNSKTVVRVPFLEEPQYRASSTSADLRFVNGYFEPIKNVVKNKIDYFFTKRPGLSQNIRPSGTTGTGRGCYAWKGNIYSVVGTKIYKNSTDLGVTLTTSSGLCYFQETRPGAATNYLCLNDGVKLYAINTAGAVTTVTVNYPNPNVRLLEYMNQYLMTVDTNANLWNCTADDPTSWSLSQYIVAQMMNGVGVGLAKVGNFMAVFTDRHVQLFYDNANVSGSPLNNAEQYMHRVGCNAADTIRVAGDHVLWVGNSANGGYTVWQMTGPSKIDDVGSPTINRILSLEGSSLSSARSITFRSAGHLFYALTLSSANRTFVYDPDINYWYEWTDTAGTGSWPIVSTAEISGGVIAQHATNGWIYNLSTSVYQDDSSSFTVLARTPRVDLDTNQRKFVNNLDVVYDKQSSSENITVTYSDDDYTTNSTGVTFDISRVRSFIQRLGNFRRRSWQVTYSGTQPFRAYGIELDVSLES